MLAPQPLIKALPALFDAKQEPVRDGVKKLTVRLTTHLPHPKGIAWPSIIAVWQQINVR